jgi:chemotaxis methyl-accepting protein methylase
MAARMKRRRLTGEQPPQVQPQVADEPGFAALCQKIERDRGFRCPNYKDTCLRRRISVRMRARSAATYAEYSAILDGDSVEYDRLIQALTINVTKFFRNPESFACLATRVIPELWMTKSPLIRVWSAGCSTGEEPYSLAVLFREHAVSLGDLPGLSRLRIVATDVDREALATASRGQYPDAALGDTPPAVSDRYFPLEKNSRTVTSEIRNLVTFEHRDLLDAKGPGGRLHLIVCRNVIIYFTRETQERLFELFHELLLPGGFLVLGKVETLLGKSRERFAPVSSRDRIFRRL